MIPAGATITRGGALQSTNGAAHAELTPLRFLERASAVFPDQVAIVDGSRRIAYREFACEGDWPRRSPSSIQQPLGLLVDTPDVPLQRLVYEKTA